MLRSTRWGPPQPATSVASARDARGMKWRILMVPPYRMRRGRAAPCSLLAAELLRCAQHAAPVLRKLRPFTFLPTAWKRRHAPPGVSVGRAILPRHEREGRRGRAGVGAGGASGGRAGGVRDGGRAGG